MASEELKNVFEAFSQGDHIKNQDYNYVGPGLGMAISKELVEFHGGTIRAEGNGRGDGSKFVIELPLANAAPTKQI